jgi:hypothetical protein
VRVTGAVNVALNERRVLVPKETFASNVSPPPKTFRILLVALWESKKTKQNNETETVCVRGIKWVMRTAVPSLFPTSVEVLRKKRGRSLVEKMTSTSPGFAAGSAEGSKRAWTD